MTWNFVPPKSNPGTYTDTPITVRAGDYNLDGYPDLVVVLRNSTADGYVFIIVLIFVVYFSQPEIL